MPCSPRPTRPHPAWRRPSSASRTSFARAGLICRRASCRRSATRPRSAWRPGGTGPYLTAAFANVDEDRARTQMAKLQSPLVKALSPGRTGQAPSFDAKKVGDVVVRSVRISPALDLAYAIFDGKLVVSTNPVGVRQAIEGDESLDGSEAYQASTSDAQNGVSALVFLNLESLVRSSQPLGLGQIVRGFGEDIAKLSGLGLTVKRDEDSLQSTLFVDIR